MSDRFDRISRLDAAFHFCEDFAASAAQDRDRPPLTGPLSDTVIGIKSNIRVRGQAWTAGIGARAERIARTDAPVVAALRAAGATVLSRLAMDEGALGAATDNPHFGRCDNPAWPGHSAGGSSGGSAASVAAGATDAALGSDTLGSVRIPAAYCGVLGLKFGSGAVDMAGVMPLAPSLDSLGVHATTPAMIARLLDVLGMAGGPAEIAGWCLPCEQTLLGCTVEIRHAVDAAARRLERLLGPPDPFPPLDLPALRGDGFVKIEVEAIESLGGETGLSAGLKKLIDYGRSVMPRQMDEIRGRLTEAKRGVLAALGGCRALLLPTVGAPAFAHGTRPPVGQADFTALANIAGVPAIAIPVRGAHPPISIQLVGPPASERALLKLAERL